LPNQPASDQVKPSRWRIFLMGAASLVHEMEGHAQPKPVDPAPDLLPGWYRYLPRDALRHVREVPLLRAEIARKTLNRLMGVLVFLLCAGVWLILISQVTGDLARLASRTALWWTHQDRPTAVPIAGVLGALFPLAYLLTGLCAAGVTVSWLQHWRVVPFSRPLLAHLDLARPTPPKR
jgi:hypothetical protein